MPKITRSVEINMQQMAHCICSIPCEYGRSYIGETGRLPAVWLSKCRQIPKEGLIQKSLLARHAYDRHRVGWDKARILEIESSSRYMKLTHMVRLTGCRWATMKTMI
jgi:hypothetical protein